MSYFQTWEILIFWEYCTDIGYNISLSNYKYFQCKVNIYRILAIHFKYLKDKTNIWLIMVFHVRYIRWIHCWPNIRPHSIKFWFITRYVLRFVKVICTCRESPDSVYLFLISEFSSKDLHFPHIYSLSSYVRRAAVLSQLNFFSYNAFLNENIFSLKNKNFLQSIFKHHVLTI